jgi:hypothetical protein
MPLPYDVNIKSMLWIPVMVYLAVIGTIFLIKSKRASKEIASQKAMYRGMAFIFYMYIGVRLFFMLSDYTRVSPGYPTTGDTDLYFQFVALSYVCAITAFINMIYAFEKYIIRKSKFIMTIVFVILLFVNIFLLFVPSLMQTMRYINYVPLYIEIGTLFLLYLYLAKKTSGKLRRNSLIAIVGLIFMAVAAVLESENLSASGLILPYYSPLMFAIGATIFAIGQRQV